MQSSQLVALHLSVEVVRQELSKYVDAVFDQSPHSIHSISLPLPSIHSSFLPEINTQPISLVKPELPFIDILVCPDVTTSAMFLPVFELSLIIFPSLSFEFPETNFQLIFPSALVDIAIFVPINPIVSLIFTKLPLEYISVEKCKFALHFFIIFPAASEDCPFAIVVFSLPASDSVNEGSHVFVFV